MVKGVKKLRNLLRSALLEGITPVILSSSGAGKTSIIEQLIKEINRGESPWAKAFRRRFGDRSFSFAFINASMHDESDLVMRLYNLSSQKLEIVIAEDFPTENAIIFVDEITNANNDFIKMLLQPLTSQRIENVPLKNIHFIFAGNDVDESELANILPEVLKRRMAIIHWAGPTFDEWIEEYPRWIAHEIEKKYNFLEEKELNRIIQKYIQNPPYDLFAFLREKPEFFMEPIKEELGNENTASPRQWSSVARLITAADIGEFKIYDDYEIIDAPEEINAQLNVLITGLVGQRAASEFESFRRTQKYRISIDDYIERGYPELSFTQEAFLQQRLATELANTIEKIGMDTAFVAKIAGSSSDSIPGNLEILQDAIQTNPKAIDSLISKYPFLKKAAMVLLKGKFSNKTLTLSYIGRYLVYRAESRKVLATSYRNFFYGLFLIGGALSNDPVIQELANLIAKLSADASKIKSEVVKQFKSL